MPLPLGPGIKNLPLFQVRITYLQEVRITSLVIDAQQLTRVFEYQIFALRKSSRDNKRTHKQFEISLIDDFCTALQNLMIEELITEQGLIERWGKQAYELESNQESRTEDLRAGIIQNYGEIVFDLRMAQYELKPYTREGSPALFLMSEILLIEQQETAEISA